MEANSLTPGHFETTNLLIERYMTEAHFCAPGIVVSYDSTTQSASVQPSLMRKYNAPSGADIPAVPLPQINMVPVVFPATATSWVRLPVAVGDQVMLHFSDRSLDLWWTSGGIVDPEIPHKFSLTDAIAVPGLRSKGTAINPKGAPTSLEICNGNVWLELMATGQVKLSNGVVDLVQGLYTFLNGLNSATLTAQATAFLAIVAPFAGIL